MRFLLGWVAGLWSVKHRRPQCRCVNSSLVHNFIPCLITRSFFYLAAFHSTPKAHELAPQPNPRLHSPHHHRPVRVWQLSPHRPVCDLVARNRKRGDHGAVGVCLVVVWVGGSHLLSAAPACRMALGRSRRVVPLPPKEGTMSCPCPCHQTIPTSNLVIIQSSHK